MSIGCFILFNEAFNELIPIFLVYSVFMIVSIFYTHKNIPKETYTNTKNNLDLKNSFSFLTYLKENVGGKVIYVSYLYIPAAILNMVLPVHLGKLISKYNKMTIITVSLVLNILCWVYFTTITDFNALVVLFTIMSIIGTTIGLACSSVKKSIFENS